MRFTHVATSCASRPTRIRAPGVRPKTRLTKAANSTHGANTNPVPIKLTNAPISFGSGSNVWNSSGCAWNAGSPCRGGRSFLFLLSGFSTDEGNEIEPRDCEMASSCVERRRVTSNVPLEARRAVGGLAGFYDQFQLRYDKSMKVGVQL